MLHGNEKNNGHTNTWNVLITSFISGAAAGAICDVTMYPLDTLKTRLQSQHGFKASGGFKKLYLGMTPVVIGSAPAASLFFVTYEGIKEIFQPRVPQKYHVIIHMAGASFAEMMACLIRVPVEVIKQRRQALLIESEKLGLKMMFRGYGSTVLRDVPFGLLQMPLWEYFKLCLVRAQNRECSPVESAFCGAASVAISACVTTPLDVAKTRIMLSCSSANKEETKISTMLKEVYRENGPRGLFAGFVPRTTSFTVGGFVYFGIYDQAKEVCAHILPHLIPSLYSTK